jgi:uncharacterized phage protein gp47/JayE
MVTIRSVNEIILSLIDFFKVAQPDLDTKPGTVARDLMIDAPASQVAILYDQLSSVSNKQSLRLVTGSDLDNLAKNFGIIRKNSTSSTGVALMTFASINATININKGDLVFANNNFTFKVANGASVDPSSLNYYRSIAAKYRDQLDFVGISDQYAVEITVIASSSGSIGNIGKYSLTRTNIGSVTNVTNINGFSGGTDQESDVVFRNRVLSSFSGSSVGTALGYLNAALGIPGVSDAAVVEPGSPLMTRDGTVVTKNADGSNTIVSEGSGGKVDVIILGSTLTQDSDSYIYIDRSNNNDPTDSKNDVILGQISGDAGKTINRKRIDNLASSTLPSQPITNIIDVTGTSSGSNFIEKSVDSYDRVSGNYELIKDTGVYAGCPWGFDKIHWISNYISLFNEDKIKGQFNGQDATTFSDVLEVPKITQNISITNENSKTTSDKTIIQLLHTPASSVTRVVNVNTGERYLITDQNPDKTGVYNTTGRIKISGNTLPTSSDLLQVDYGWIVDYDQYSDYDGLSHTYNPRTVNDSIDWGYSSVIKNEKIVFVNSGTNFFTGTSSHNISSVISANKFTEIDGAVIKITSGIFVNRLAVVINNLTNPVSSVESITLKNSNVEIFSTAQNDGSFSNVTGVVGIDIVYNSTIILPTDTSAIVGNSATVTLNSTDTFNTSSGVGSNNSTQITIPSAAINTTATSIVLSVNYIALVSDFASTAITSIPMSRSGNGFTLSNNNGFPNFSTVNTSHRENLVVQKNLSNQYYVETSLLANDFTFTTDLVVAIVRLVDGKLLWNSDNIGSIATGTSGNYQIILNGFNTPAINDMVIVIYYAIDIRRFQPYSFRNNIIKTRVDTLLEDGATGKLYVPINNLIAQPSGIVFDIFEPNTNINLFSVTDGYMTISGDTGLIASLATTPAAFSVVHDLTNKKLKIRQATNSNNNGIYDIISYNPITNIFVIKNVLNNISADQVSIVRLLDGKEVWDYSGTISITNNKLLLSSSAKAYVNDFVYVTFLNFKNLRKSPSRIISTTIDQAVNTGVLSISGTSISKAADIIFTATNTGLKLNLAEGIRKALGLNSTTAIPSNVKLAKLAKLEKVATVSNSSDEVLEVYSTYDVKNTIIQNNLLYTDEMISNSTLSSLEFILPSTTNNTLNSDVINLPKIGDKLRATFYYTTDNDIENLSYTRNGALYSNKKFALINKVYASSGFKTSQSTRLTLTSFNQPSLGSRYSVYYDYLAPKQNERIAINFNYNSLITSATLNIENSRPINADVIVRSGKNVLLDLTMNIVIADTYLNSSTSVVQSVKDSLITAMTTNKLGSIVDNPTLINVAQAVTGVARARILYFNKTGSIGQVLSVQAQGDEYLSPNNIIINTETR